MWIAVLVTPIHSKRYTGAFSMDTTDYKPYTYIIGWTSHNVWYFGSESAIITKIAHPRNLWTTYFTSSELVSKFRQLHGDPDIVKVVKIYDTAEQARAAETAYLSRINAACRSNWLNQHNGSDKFHTSGLKMITDGKRTRMINPDHSLPDGWWFGVDEKSRKNKKIAIQNREIHFTSRAHELSILSRQNKQLCNNGIIQKWLPLDQPITPGWCLGQLPQKTEATRKYLTGKNKSELTKSKISLKHMGNKWFNNGIEEIHSKDCPEGWMSGRLPITDEARINRGNAQKGLKWFTDGSQCKQFRNIDDAPIGWYPGRIVSKSSKPRKSSQIQWFWITDGQIDKKNRIEDPIPEGYRKGKCKNYSGPKKRKVDLTVYNLYHPKHGTVSGTRQYFEQQWGITKGKFNRIKRSKLAKPYGWRLLS